MPSQVKTLIAETIGVRQEDIVETRITKKKKVTAQIKLNRRNEERLKRSETQDVTFNWNDGSLQKTKSTMLKTVRYHEVRRPENSQTTPNHLQRTHGPKDDPTQLVLLVATLMWEPEGGNRSVSGGCPGAGAASGAAGATNKRTKERECP